MNVFREEFGDTRNGWGRQRCSRTSRPTKGGVDLQGSRTNQEQRTKGSRVFYVGTSDAPLPGVFQRHFWNRESRLCHPCLQLQKDCIFKENDEDQCKERTHQEDTDDVKKKKE